jgi:hypothetical protein
MLHIIIVALFVLACVGPAVVLLAMTLIGWCELAISRLAEVSHHQVWGNKGRGGNKQRKGAGTHSA